MSDSNGNQTQSQCKVITFPLHRRLSGSHPSLHPRSEESLTSGPLEITQKTTSSDCINCLYVMMGPLGLHCDMYNESIIDPSIAVECSEFNEY